MLGEIKRLTELGWSTRDIEKVVGIGRTKTSKIIKENNFEKSKITMSQRQHEILIGTIIGDGSIFKSGGVNYRMNLAHSLKQKRYFLFKYQELKDIVKSEPKERAWKDTRTEKVYSEIRFQSKVNKVFSDLHEIWYKDGKKIINLDELMKCGEITLAIKYFDDGYKNSNGNYEIAMHDYDKDSIENLRKWMLEKFGIETTNQKDTRVYVLAKSKSTMKKIISQIDLDELHYKI